MNPNTRGRRRTMVITNVSTLVDAERGLISPRIFSEHDIY